MHTRTWRKEGRQIEALIGIPAVPGAGPARPETSAHVGEMDAEVNRIGARRRPGLGAVVGHSHRVGLRLRVGPACWRVAYSIFSSVRCCASDSAVGKLSEPELGFFDHLILENE